MTCSEYMWIISVSLVISIVMQVGHAALGLYRLLMEDKEKYEASTEEWEEFG